MPDLPLFSSPDLREAGEVRVRTDRDAGAALGAALRLAIAEAGPLFTALFAIAGPMLVLGALARQFGGPVSGLFLGMAVDLLAGLLGVAGVLGFVRLYVRGAATDVAAVWDETTHRLPAILAFVAVLLLVVVALSIPLSLLVTAFGVGTVGLIAVAGGVAIALVLVPAMWLGMAAVGLDELPATAALARGYDLFRGQPRRCVAAAVLSVVLTVFTLVVLGGALGAVLGAGLAEGSLAAEFGGTVVSLLALPVNAVVTLFWVMVYGSLVEAAEGASLGEGLDRLAGVLDDRPVRPEPVRAAATRPAETSIPSRAQDRTEPAASADGRDDGRGDETSGNPGDGARGGFRGGGFSDTPS